VNGDNNRELIERYWNALASGDLDTAYQLRHEDFVSVWPQSGERIVGRDNARTVDERYPNWPEMRTRRIVGSEDLWVVEATLTYDGADVYQAVAIVELRDGKVAAETAYWGAPFEAEAWRAEWVERFDPMAT
jgi:ketosteroid isomerase-like protein